MSMGSASCPACAAELPERARFCLDCGEQVARRSDEEESRRTVTLVFTDVTGSTALGERLDPEALRGVMGRYFEVAREAVERHGGTVEKFVGDAVLAVFGMPQVHEDDALRAVRAASEVHAAIGQLSEELTRTLGVELVIRTGVNTGSVVAGAARAGGSFATGDAVNTAARLEQAATPGEILLGPATHAMVRDAVRVGPERLVTARGKAEPVPARPLLAVDDAATEGRARRHDAPLVAREYELRVLRDALERTVATGRGHVATVLGGPGMGKTRLLNELAEQFSGPMLRGRCVSYGVGLAWWPVAQALRTAFGLAGGESRDVVRKALLDNLLDDSDLEAVVDRLLPLLVTGVAPVSHDEASWAVCRVFEQLASSGPVVLVVDDLHWAEQRLIELLDQVREETRDLPVLLVGAARPELLDQHPSWARGAANSVSVSLEAFDDGATAAVISSRLGGDTDPEAVAAITKWAGGNPLFVQELVSHLQETDRLQQVAGRWRLTARPAGVDLPPTVGALLGARIDRLEPQERRVLERISVIGLEVRPAEAVALVDDGADVPAVLAELARRDLLRRTRSHSGDIWSFRHVLVREAAYDRLSKASRAALHERFADHLESHAGDNGADHLAFVAHHLALAAELCREVSGHGEQANGLVVRAVAALFAANQHARDREDVTAAAELLRRTVELRSPDPAQHREALVRLLCHHQQHFEAAAAREVNARLADEVGDERGVDALLVEAARLTHAVDVGEAVDPAQLHAAAEELLARAGEGSRWHEHMGLLAMCESLATGARWREVRRHYERIVRHGDSHDRRQADAWAVMVFLYGPFPATELLEFATRGVEAARSPRNRARMLLAQAVAHAALDLPDAAVRLEDRVAAAAELPEAEHYVHMHAAEGFYLLGDLGRAAALAGHAVKSMVELGDYGQASTYQAWWARVRLENGEDVERVRPVVEQAAGWTSPHDVASVAEVAAARALVAARTGDVDEALSVGERAIAVIDSSDMTQTQADLRRALAEVHLTAGDTEAARTLLGEARAWYEAKEFHGMVRRVDETLAALVHDLREG